jgi:hypothetical protein
VAKGRKFKAKPMKNKKSTSKTTSKAKPKATSKAKSKATSKPTSKAKPRSRYPKKFKSELLSTGSMTVDPGHELHVEVNKNGFYAVRVCEFSIDDIFGELGYWPDKVVWSRKGPLLSDLLSQLAKERGLGERKLRKIVSVYFMEYQGVDINAYMTKERKRAKSPRSLAEFHRETPFEIDFASIPAIPSPEIKPKSFQNGLEIRFRKGQWNCKLFSNSWDDEIFGSCDGSWDGDTFDELFEKSDEKGFTIEDYFHWDRAELARLLIEDDERWRPFVESNPSPD